MMCLWQILGGIRMRRIATIIIIFMTAQAGAHAKSIQVKGAVSCAMWAAARQAKAATPQQGHLIGLLSGLSLGSGTSFWFREGGELTDQQAYYWMDVFCMNNPLSYVTTGAVKLLDERSDGEYTRRIQSQIDD